MKCSKCGKDIANDSYYCEYCGALIRESEYKVHVKWLLYLAMFFTCVINILIMGLSCVMGITDNTLLFLTSCNMVAQFCIIIISSLLIKKIPGFVLLLSVIVGLISWGLFCSIQDGFLSAFMDAVLRFFS